ncbi:MAG: HDOD domain-containing protein [Thermodesulfobacteriota bacterium]
MKIKCPGCKKNINIKEGTYPDGKIFSFLCPGCGYKIKVNPLENISGKNFSNNQHLYGDNLKSEILNSSPSLPPVPDVLIKARKILDNPGHTSKDLSSLISLDQAIAARVLKLANSAYFGFNPPIPTIDEACILLGEKNLMSIIMIAQMSKMLDKELKGYSIAPGNLFFHSIAAAVAADIIANEKMPLFELDAFASGLLHDCGKLLLDDYIYMRKKEFMILVNENKDKCYEAEIKMFGFSHEEIGFDLLESWKLPEIQTHAIGYHHHPSKSGKNELSYILNAADYLACAAGFSAASSCSENQHEPDPEVMQFLSIEMYELDDFAEKVEKNVLNMTKDFSF